MPRIPRLVVAVLADLLVATLPLASAQPLPARPYLQLVLIVGTRPRLEMLVLRDPDLPIDRQGYRVLREGVLTNDAAATAYADSATALAQFAAQGRLEGYELVAEKFAAHPARYYSQVTRYASAAGAAAGLDISTPAGCSQWTPYVFLELYGGEQARAKERVCTSGRVGYTDQFVAVRRGAYVTTVQMVAVPLFDDATLNALLVPAVAMLP